VKDNIGKIFLDSVTVVRYTYGMIRKLLAEASISHSQRSFSSPFFP